jgi:hypothetical protein
MGGTFRPSSAARPGGRRGGPRPITREEWSRLSDCGRSELSDVAWSGGKREGIKGDEPVSYLGRRARRTPQDGRSRLGGYAGMWAHKESPAHLDAGLA